MLCPSLSYSYSRSLSARLYDSLRPNDFLYPALCLSLSGSCSVISVYV